MKECSKCKVLKYPNEFGKRKSSTDGLYSWCKICTRLYNKNQYFKHIDKRKTKRKEIYQNNSKEAKRKTKEWRIKNHKRFLLDQRERYRNMTPEQHQKALERKRKFDKTDKGKQSAKKYRKGPKWVCRYTFRNAIRDGKIVKQDKCSICFSEERVEGHHPDYTKPLDVVWLCRKCHSAIHQSLKKRKDHESS